MAQAKAHANEQAKTKVHESTEVISQVKAKEQMIASREEFSSAVA